VAILRLPLVAFAFVVERLRRLPVGGFVLRNSALVATALFALAFIALTVWGLTRAPQRISLAELAAGGLSPMQSWIIISGDLQPAPTNSPGLRYRLTDPAAPGASVIVQSTAELATGWTTISGMYVGTREPLQAGFNWIGQMRAEPELAPEQAPPWVALGLAVAGLLVGVSARFSYPMFFAERPHPVAPRSTTLDVGVRGEIAGAAGQLVGGLLRLRPDEPVELAMPGVAQEPLRIYAAHTSISPGELRDLSGAEPVLRVRRAAGDLDIVFASADERDAVFAVLAAERRGRASS